MKQMASGKTIDQLLRERLRELGAIGGKAAAGKLSKTERAAKAKKAAAARWSEKKSAPLQKPTKRKTAK
jgi:hypothetical protein